MKLTQTTIEETDQPAYDVHLRPTAKHLTVGQTTIEKVAEHVDFFKDLVAKIAPEGEEYQKRADEAQRQADEQESARREEQVRRRALAAKIKFD